MLLLLFCVGAFLSASVPLRAQNATPVQNIPVQFGAFPPSPDALPQAVPPKQPRQRPKLYTNDNMPVGPGEFGIMDFSNINDCDRQCFEQVRQLAHITPYSSPNWKRDLLQALDPVRKDPDWQVFLRQLYDAHLHFCHLGDEKREELARVADPNNVTTRELAVDDKFDAKFREAQTSLQTLYLRQRPLQQKFAYNNYSLQFSQLQISRVQNAPCPGQQQRYTASGPADDQDQ